MPRWVEVSLRLLAAVAGGYALSLAIALAMAVAWPAVAQIRTAASLISIVVWVAVVIWSFAARDAVRAWCGLLVPMLLAVWLTLHGSGAVA